MSHVRAISRLLGLGLLTSACFLAWLLTRPLDWLAPRAGRWTSDRLTVGWACCMLRLMGGRIRVEGTPSPDPHLLVSNHLSYVDILVFLSQGCWTIVAKSEVAQWPLMGLIARSVGTVFVDRSSRTDLGRVIAQIGRALARQRSILVFPEGTSSPGQFVLPFKASLFEVAVHTACPVNVAVVGYRTRQGLTPAQQAICWWGDMTFPDHLYRLLGLPGFEAAVRFGSDSIRQTNRKAYALQAHAAVCELFTPVFVAEVSA